MGHCVRESVFAVDRDKCRSDYEEKLRCELEQLRVRTDVEIDRLKTSTREMYERENRLHSVIDAASNHLCQLSLLSLQGVAGIKADIY